MKFSEFGFTIDRMDVAHEAAAVIQFGRFSVSPRRRELLADGQPIELGDRAFDVLMALIAEPGAVVSKEALFESVWPNRIVEENSLHAQISALRKALGSGRDVIRTVAGRGYQFTGAVQIFSAGPDPPTDAPSGQPRPVRAEAPTNVPASVSELIGRDVELAGVLQLIATHRLVTLTGPGGIGKTRLALEVARNLPVSPLDGVWFIELAALSDLDLVPSTIANALGVEIAPGGGSAKSVAKALATRQITIILDNCEHLSDAAAQFVELLLRTNPLARVLTTSRDPLRAEGEQIFRVGSLEAPWEDRRDIENPLQYGAVRLFVERASAADPRFRLNEHNARRIAAICRSLDGIPLAIELAAARVGALGIAELESRLADRLGLLTGGRRTALPRQRTLRATLDWSYDLLTEAERLIFRRLSVFAGGFTTEAARSVALSPEVTKSGVVDCVLNLVAKSLVAVDFGGPIARYRLLGTTRTYALEKLAESGERSGIARRHAEYFRDLFQQAEAESETRPAADWLATYGADIDNVRTSLDWAFSPEGDTSVGVTLTIAMAPHWFQFSQVEECLARADRALASVGPGSGQDPHLELQLSAARAKFLTFGRPAAFEDSDAWTKVFNDAEALGDVPSRLQALRGLYQYYLSNGEVRNALERSEEYLALATKASVAADSLVGEQMIGISLHFLGDQRNAKIHIERMLEGYPSHAPASHTIRFSFEQREVGRTFRARVLWLLGYPDQAMQIALSVSEHAQSLNHAPTVCQVLAFASCPIALLVGDVDRAEEFINMLAEHSAGLAIDAWSAWAHCLRGVLMIRRGDFIDGTQQVKAGYDDMLKIGVGLLSTSFLGAIGEGLAGSGRVAEGLATIDEALALCVQNEDLWCFAELLRLRGDLLLLQGGPEAQAMAEDCYVQGLDWAGRQGALSWELRCATSMARLWRDRGQATRARERLASVYDRFTEGFTTSDLRAAKDLIDEMS